MDKPAPPPELMQLMFGDSAVSIQAVFPRLDLWCRAFAGWLVSLKTYAAWAGLDASRVTYASLRHTAATLRLEQGATTAGLHDFLGWRYLKEMRRYITHLGRILCQRRPPHRQARPSLPARAVLGPYRRKKPHAQLGNLNARRPVDV